MHVYTHMFVLVCTVYMCAFVCVCVCVCQSQIYTCIHLFLRYLYPSYPLTATYNISVATPSPDILRKSSVTGHKKGSMHFMKRDGKEDPSTFVIQEGVWVFVSGCGCLLSVCNMCVCMCIV